MIQGESLSHGTADVMGNNMGGRKLPVVEQLSKNGCLTGDRRVHGWIPRALGMPVAQQIENVNIQSGLDETGDDITPNE